MCAESIKHEKRMLWGVHSDSTIQKIYDALCDGRKLTNLSSLKAMRTMYLPKYVSVLRNKYNVPVLDKWISVGEPMAGKGMKQVKVYWIEMVD